MSAAARTEENLAAQTDETLIIETPERVPLHFALASIGNRFLACAVDHVLQALCFLVLYFVFDALVSSLNASGLGGASRWAMALLFILIFLTMYCYFTLFEWRLNGQTPGKRWLKLRVIREDGRPITFWEAAVRNLLRIVDLFWPPFYSIGLISVFVSKRGQRVGDFVAGTVVVRERETEAPTFNQVFDSPVSDTALRRACKPVQFTADLGPVTEREIEVVETFLRRRYDLPDHARMWMAWRVATPLLYKLRPGYNLATFTYEGFLEELLHRYHERHRFKK
ncbi:MAG TPA: RDD family protein [Pyrinomonadaceae bacterium]|nr:RDD family protein [Pyrinomonadaceae bacterium]